MITVRHLPTPPDPRKYALAPRDITVGGYLDTWCTRPSVLAMDTEDAPDGTLWSIQISGAHGSALVIPTSNVNSLRRLSAYIVMHSPLIVFHSALHDVPKVERTLGITLPRFRDTMVMAYLLQDEPLGLKALAWRHANIRMKQYVEVIGEARKAKALEYLSFVSNMEWPALDPILVYQKGNPRIKQPQGIGPKAKRIMGDVEKGKTLKDGTLIDPRKRWHNIKVDEGRGQVESVLGPMPDAFLCDVDEGEAITYAACDADMTLRVYDALLSRLQDLNMEHLIEEEALVARFIEWMHTTGLPASRDRFNALAEELERAMGEVELDITRASGGWTGQLSSHPQVSALLYDVDQLNLRSHLPTKRSKKAGKTMTGDDILAQIEHVHPVVKYIRDWRKLEKLLNTYARGVPQHIREDERVHADFRNTNTDTGRLSCADPNLMAQPKRNKEWAKKLRKAFTVPPGYVMLSMDYSQIELRLTAEEANEEAMIRAFVEGIDLHSLTASEMFDVPIDKVDTLTQRLPAKTINFGIIYGISAKGLYRNMVVIEGCEHWTEGLAQTYIDKYFERRPGIRAYIADTISMARRYGYVWDWAGRIRRIPGARLVNEYYRAEAERQAGNARIQTGAQSIIKRAMAELVPVYQGWREMGYDLSPVIQIHDDIVSLVPEDIVDIVVPVQKEIMENVKHLKAGVRVDVEWSNKSWGEMESWNG